MTKVAEYLDGTADGYMLSKEAHYDYLGLMGHEEIVKKANNFVIDRLQTATKPTKKRANITSYSLHQRN